MDVEDEFTVQFPVVASTGTTSARPTRRNERAASPIRLLFDVCIGTLMESTLFKGLEDEAYIGGRG